MRKVFRISSSDMSRPIDIYHTIERIVKSNRHYNSGGIWGVFHYLPSDVTVDLHLDNAGFTASKNDAIIRAVAYLKQIAKSKGLKLEEIGD